MDDGGAALGRRGGCRKTGDVSQAELNDLRREFTDFFRIRIHHRYSQIGKGLIRGAHIRLADNLNQRRLGILLIGPDQLHILHGKFSTAAETVEQCVFEDLSLLFNVEPRENDRH